jgi:hypothetical protein
MHIHSHIFNEETKKNIDVIIIFKKYSNAMRIKILTQFFLEKKVSERKTSFYCKKVKGIYLVPKHVCM